MKNEPWLCRGMVAVVTGASSGIGLSIANRLALEGIVVACLSRSAKQFALPSDLSPDGRLVPFACDVRNAKSVKTTIDKVVDSFGKINILINAAGVSMPESLGLLQVKPKLWKQIIDTNLTGVYNMMHFTLPYLLLSKGYIINILSTAAFRGNAGNAPYTASKYGARALSETAALEGALEGVRVASISPGPVNTNIWSHKIVPPNDEKKMRMLNPEDIADIAIFLLKTSTNVVIGNITVTPLRY